VIAINKHQHPTTLTVMAQAGMALQHICMAAWLFHVPAMGCGDDRNDAASSSASGLASVGPTSATTSDDAASADAASADGGSEPTGQTAGGSSGATDPSGEDDADSSPSSASGSDDGPRFDVLPGVSSGDDGVLPPGTCRIDFLFVIDSSCSMGNDQDNINASLSGFVSTIQTKFGDHDHHIMVVDTDAVDLDEYTICRTQCALGLGTMCGTIPCTALPPDDPCNSTLGTGLRNSASYPIGPPCNFLGGKRYILDGQPDLDATFHCVADFRGDTGLTDERAAGALLAAISPELNAPGACNEGFLRRDALLVVTMITDEDDDPTDHITRIAMDADFNSPGDPASWKQGVVDAKNGDEGAVVMLGLLGDPDVAMGTWCPPLLTDEDGEKSGIEGAEETHRLREFSSSFIHGAWAGICEPNYAPFFDQAVSVIDTACKEFVPPPE